MPAKRTAFPRQGCGRQHGAALMVMLVILVIGVAAILVSALSSSSLQIERDRTTADALAKAKAALIGYAASDSNFPGELPCPDVNDDGQLTMGVDYSGSSCVSPIGRLPWKTLGIPELRDGAGEHLWYAVSKPFWAMGSPNINSDTVGNLIVTDATSGTTVNNLIAIVFAPGNALSTQSRSSTQTANCTTTGDTAGTTSENNCATNYLEGTNPAATWNIFTAPSAGINTGDPTTTASSTFNDQLIYITHGQLFQPVETRIAREAKKCLDDYAADATNTNHRYPWAASDSDTSYTGNYDTLFGRIAAAPRTTTTSLDSTASTMLTALSSLQTALNAYSANINATTTSALLNAGNTLITAAQNAASSSSFSSYSSITGNADTAGDKGRDLANGVAGVYVSTVQGYIDSTKSYLSSNGFVDSSMPSTVIWPSSCVFNSGYWGTWQQEVFYQVAAGNSPGTSVSVCNLSCLTINGSGNPNSGNGTYHAAIIVGRAHNASGSPTSNPPSYYLEGGNLHDSTKNYSTTPQVSQTFEAYRPTDPSYSSVNDLVVCLDGKNYCK